MEHIEFKYQISYKEYKNSVLELNKLNYIVRAVFVVFLLVAPLLDPSYDRVFSYFLSFVITLFIIFPLYSGFRKAKNTYQTKDSFREELNYVLNRETIHIAGKTTYYSFSWTNFCKIKETKVFLVLFTNTDKASAFFLPKKALKKEELELLRKWLTARIGSDKLLKQKKYTDINLLMN